MAALGWHNPITILSPFVIHNNNDKQTIGIEEARKIWEKNPAPKHLLDRTIIEQKFIKNVKSKPKGVNTTGHFRQTQQHKQTISNNNRRVMQ